MVEAVQLIYEDVMLDSGSLDVKEQRKVLWSSVSQDLSLNVWTSTHPPHHDYYHHIYKDRDTEQLLQTYLCFQAPVITAVIAL
jgi:hypothetical protein